MRAALRRGGRLLGLALMLAGPARAAKTVVSLSFDDTDGDQVTAQQLMDQYGVKGTFFINSPRIGIAGFLTMSQVRALAAAGHEIAGHTLDHPDLTTLTTSQMTTEICHDRQALISDGFNPISFAYPFGSFNSTVEGVVQSCGYRSARIVGGLDCPGCIKAETIPPANAFAVRTPDSVQSGTTLSQVEQYVTAAEQSGGGWVPLIFHHICDGCDQYSVSSTTLAGFISWLAARSGQGTVVETVAQAMGILPGDPAPWISTLSPASAVAGGSTFTLTVNGSNFVSGSTVRWNGSARATSFASGTRLTAAILASDLASAGTAAVTVANPDPNGGSSNSAAFTIVSPNPIPVLGSLSPSVATAGGPAFKLTVNGSSFVSGATVLWNGSARATSFVSSARLTAAIFASDLASVGTAAVTVFNPSPGGGSSNGASFAIVPPNPDPVLASISPSAATAHSPGLTLTVAGSGFISSSTVRWNGSARATSFVSSARLTAAILASDLQSTGTASVAVFTPAPGGGASNTQAFTIAAPDSAAQSLDVGSARVFPNPWRADRHTGLGVTVDRVPAQSEVRFFTLSGRWVRTVAAPAGTGTWDLTDDTGERVASGLYLYLITDPGGTTKRGALTVIR